MGLLLSTRFSRTKAIIYTSITAFVVLLGVFGASAFHLHFLGQSQLAFTFVFPWVLLMIIAIVLNIVIIMKVRRRKEDLPTPERRLVIKNKANKWFLIALAGIVVVGMPLYWDWNVGTSHRGYSFIRVDFRDIDYIKQLRHSHHSSARIYQITNINELSRFHGEVILFVQDNVIVFDGMYFYYSVHSRGFGIWHDIHISPLPMLRGSDMHFLHGLPRHNFSQQIHNQFRPPLATFQYLWDDFLDDYLYGHISEGRQRAYIISSAIMNAEMVQSVGFTDNFFRAIRTPTLALLAVYTLFRIGLHVKPAIAVQAEMGCGN